MIVWLITVEHTICHVCHKPFCFTLGHGDGCMGVGVDRVKGLGWDAVTYQGHLRE